MNYKSVKRVIGRNMAVTLSFLRRVFIANIVLPLLPRERRGARSGESGFLQLLLPLYAAPSNKAVKK